VRYWLKIASFSYPRAFDAPIMWVAAGILPWCLVQKN